MQHKSKKQYWRSIVLGLLAVMLGASIILELANSPIFSTKTWATSMAFTPENDLLLGMSNGRIKVTPRNPGDRERIIYEGKIYEKKRVSSQIAYSPDGKYLASGSRDGALMIWKAPDFQLKLDKVLHAASITSIAFSPDSSMIATGGGPGDERIIIWDIGRSEKKSEIKIDKNFYGVLAMAFSPDGKWLFSTGNCQAGGGGSTLAVWEVATSRQLFNIEDQPHTVSSLSISSDGKYLASSNYTDEVQVRTISNPENIEKRVKSPVVIYGIQFHAKHNILVIIGSVPSNKKSKISLVNLRTDKMKVIEVSSTGQMRAFALSADGKKVAVRTGVNPNEVIEISELIDELNQ
jgi:WD40 repeat protein